MSLKLIPPSTKPPWRISPSALSAWLSLYGQVEGIVSLFVCAQMLSSALQNEPAVLVASRFSPPLAHS